MSLPIPNFIKYLFYPILKRMVSPTHSVAPVGSKAITSFYELVVNDINGNPKSLSAYKGKKILIVNTASDCGYTPQYIALQKLHDKHSTAIVVLGFPCNDFGAQEPGDESSIKNFCEKKYSVTFPLFSKIQVKGTEKHVLYQWLTDASKNGWNTKEPTWNFCKYLIDETGNLIAVFGPSTDPLDGAITGEKER